MGRRGNSRAGACPYPRRQGDANMDQDRAAEREFVLRNAQENDVKFLGLWFADILGSLKGFAITFDDLEDAIGQDVGFDAALSWRKRAAPSDL